MARVNGPIFSLMVWGGRMNCFLFASSTLFKSITVSLGSLMVFRKISWKTFSGTPLIHVASDFKSSEGR